MTAPDAAAVGDARRRHLGISPARPVAAGAVQNGGCPSPPPRCAPRGLSPAAIGLLVSAPTAGLVLSAGPGLAAVAMTGATVTVPLAALLVDGRAGHPAAHAAAAVAAALAVGVVPGRAVEAASHGAPRAVQPAAGR